MTISLDTNYDSTETWNLDSVLPFVDIFMPNEVLVMVSYGIALVGKYRKYLALVFMGGTVAGLYMTKSTHAHHRMKLCSYPRPPQSTRRAWLWLKE